MKMFHCSTVQVSAALISLATNAVLFSVLNAGFGGVKATELAVLQLPSVTVLGKRLAVTPEPVKVARTRAMTTPANEIKL